MSVRNEKGKHMSAEGADKFEEKLEGADFGNMEDWEAKLLERIIKTEILLDKASKLSPPNKIAIERMQKKMIKYNVALEFMTENVKVAVSVGARGGLDAIMDYLEKAAVEKAAKLETYKYSDKLMPHLPGVRLNKSIAAGGRVDVGEEVV